MDHSCLTEKIIGCAYSVYNTLGSGFLESVYEKCLAIEFSNIDLVAEFQKNIDVFYEDHNVGSFVADILVEGEIVVELKAVRNLTMNHEVQLVNYLAATKKSVGLLLNFGESKVEVRRKVLFLEN